jgi:glycosyltransferase involved in cell wall biosynthesis
MYVREEVQLAIVWNHDYLTSTAYSLTKSLGLSDQVRFLRNVSDDDLLHLYNGAAMFIFPSLEEGFGLPPLEAMACGTPVLAANNSSMPEILGDSALLFDAEDDTKLSNLILYVISDEKIQKSLKDAGLKRASLYSWDDCARATLNVYEKMCAASTRAS